MEGPVVLVSFCCFFAHICSRPSLLLSTDRVPRQTERTAGTPAVLFHAPPAPQPSLFSADFRSVCDSTAAQRRSIVIPHNIAEKLTAIPIDFAQNLCYPKAINQTAFG